MPNTARKITTTLSDNSLVHCVTLVQDVNIVTVDCIDEKHADELLKQVAFAGFEQLEPAIFNINGERVQ